MDVRVLGELEAFADDGSPLPVRGFKQRALLAILALHRGEPVGFDRLIDDIWGEEPPGNPANALQALVAQLRRSLGAATVATTDAGYALSIAPDDVDAIRFEQLVADGRRSLEEGDVAGASRTLRTALELCRGEPLAEFAFAEFAAGERARIEELTLLAIEARVDADLALAHHAEVIGALEVLVRQHPLRERLWEQLMLALYRAGRQADALRVYGEAREHLIEELGLEPGPSLRKLEAQVLAQDETLDAPSGRIAAAERVGNLRAPLTRFFGREAERARVLESIETNRLVTIIGPGGAGKTRLALESASAVQHEHEDGAWFVELAGVRDAEGVAPAIASTIGGSDAGAGESTIASTVELLVRRLHGASLVIVLDNCEHVIDEAASVAQTLLSAVPGLKVIATSRESLAVPGEVLLPVGGLGADDAMAVFVDRAQAVRADFVVDETSSSLIEDICRRLDGLPLALELAAARLQALPLGQLVARLDDRFRVLTGRSRGALPRQQTLRAVVDWSYDLLFADERRLFDRLSVFTGGCDLAAVEAVCRDDELPAGDIVDVLSRLVDKSLVNAEFDDLGGVRYTQLQTLWQYGRERLAESGDADNIRARHADWYLSFVQEARLGLRGADGPAWRDRVNTDFDNLRTALDRFAELGDATSALRLCSALAWIWFLRADAYEGERWLADALAVDGEASVVDRAAVELWHGFYRATTEGPGVALVEVEAATEVLRSGDDPLWLAEGLLTVSELRNRVSDLSGSVEVLAEAHVVLTELDDQFLFALHDVQLAGSVAPLGHLDEAEAAARTAVERLESIGERFVIFEGLSLLAGVAEARGDLDGAAAAYEVLLERSNEIGMRSYDPLCFIRLGAIASRRGDDEAAERLFAAGINPRRPTYSAAAIMGRAGAARRLGDLAESRQWLDEALEIYESLQVDAGCAAALTGMCWWAMAAGDLVAAAELADQACARAAKGADSSMSLSAEIAAAAVTVARSGKKTDKVRFSELVEHRTATDSGRFVAMLGGAVGASLDEPDVAAFMATL